MFNLSQTTVMRLIAGFIVLMLAAVVLLLPHAALAGTSSQVVNGELTINLYGSDDVAVSCVNGQVKLNGVDPQGGPLACASLTAIVVNGGIGDNQIDLVSVTHFDNPNLQNVVVYGGDGNDRIFASEFADILFGGAGNDIFIGVQQDDQVDGGVGTTLFAEAPLPSLPLSVSVSRPGRPSSPPASSLSALAVKGPAVAPLKPQAPGLDVTFAGVNFDNNATYNGGFLFIPPDPIAATGPTHVVSVVNTMIEWRPKSGAAGTIQSLRSFFTPLTAVNALFDPKVIYDQYAGRFVVVALEVRDLARGDPVNSSRILVAVSQTSDPTAGWWFTAINSLINISGADRWADYPGLGLDDKAVYITNNMFGFGGGTYAGTRLWIINKTPFYSGGVASVSVSDPVITGAFGFTMQPAHMFGNTPGNTGTFLVDYNGLSDGTNEYIEVVRVDNPLTSPTFTLYQFSLGNIDNTATGTLPGAPQLGTATTVNTNDRRTINAVWRDNALWAAFELLPPSGTDAGQVTAHWIKINTTNLASLTLTDQGNAGGEDIAAGAYTFFPSIAVDPCGNMALGFAASAPAIYPGAYFTGRLATDAAGTVQSSGTLSAGTDYYVRTFSGTRNRWGDYSGISLDPADEATFWVFNEYAMTRGTPTGGDGRWATQYGAFRLNTGGFDFGDLPSGYNIINRANDGARHCFNATGLRLGSLIDAESDGNPTATANGDDTTGVDDEDGITRAGVKWNNGASGGSITVTVSGGSGVLNAWIDWNGNSSFAEAGDQIITNTAVSTGNNLIVFNIPAGAFPGSGGNRTLNGRFRLTAAVPVSATVFYAGSSSSGEIEDYQWTFTPTAVTLQRVQAQPADTRLGWFILPLLIGSVMLIVYRLRRKHTRT